MGFLLWVLVDAAACRSGCPATMPSFPTFSGCTAIVTGAASGIGRELAVALAAAGIARLALCDVRADALDATKDLVHRAAVGRDQHNNNKKVITTTHVVDVSDAKAVARFARAVQAAHGDTVHLLFNNAGVAATGSFLTMPAVQFDRVIDINFVGLVRMTRAFLPMMVRAERACVVNVSSIMGIWACMGPLPRGQEHTPYCASKFAVRGFSEALMCDLRENAPHVGVAVVHPGHVGTDIAVHATDAADEAGLLGSTGDERAVGKLRFFARIGGNAQWRHGGPARAHGENE